MPKKKKKVEPTPDVTLAGYVDDKGIATLLVQRVPAFQEMRELQEWKERELEELMKQFQHVHHQKLSRLETLKSELEDLWGILQDYVEDVEAQTGRKSFLEGMVRVQKRKRVQEGYDVEALRNWARSHHILTTPKDTKMIVDFLKEAARLDLLIPDEKAALKLALETYETGEQVYSDHPAGIEEYITEISQDTFVKVMATLGIEHAVQSQDSAE